MQYAIAVVAVVIVLGLIYLYFAGRSAGKDSALKGVATAEAEKRREDDKIDAKPIGTSEASAIARKLAKPK